MKKRFTEEQIVKTLKRIEAGEKAKDVARELGVHELTISAWKRKYAGLEVSELHELKTLKDENTRLKRLVADLSLDNQILKDVNSKKW
jgi:putative transposase